MSAKAPSPALVISLIALFIALGGTSYAAITALPKNSVGTKQLKNNAVTYYKDPWGLVHIQGNAARGSGATTGTIFTLPTGYRPAKNLFFASYGNSSSIAYVQIMADGTVNAFGVSQSFVGLSEITFRAGL